MAHGEALHWGELCAGVAAVAAALAAGQSETVVVTSQDPCTVAMALLGGWQAGRRVILPGTLQPDILAQYRAPEHCCIGELGEAALLPAQLPARPWAWRSLDPAAALLELRTSGSTGEPKLVCKTIAQLDAELANLDRQWGGELGDSVILGTVSPQHFYGLIFRVLWPLCAARAMVREQFVYPEPLLAASAQFPRVAWVSSPSLLGRLHAAHDWPAVAGRLGTIFSSGAALPAAASAQIQAATGLLPVEIYGSTETGAIAWRGGDSPWRALPGVEVGPGPDGALLVRSAHIGDVGNGGWYQTGDAAQFDAGGFRLGQRLDRVVKLEDKRISLPEVEACLGQHPWVAQVSARVLSGARASLGIVVVPTPEGVQALRRSGRRALAAAWREHLAGRFDPVALPRRIRLIDTLPVNAMGKTDGQAIRDLFEKPLPRLPQVLAVQRLADHRLVAELRVPLDLECFGGHFPGTPLVPGVVQIYWAVDIAAGYLDVPGGWQGLEALKFRDFIRPGMSLELDLRWQPAQSRLEFRYRRAATVIAQGRIVT